MGHSPHLLLPGPWEQDLVDVSEQQRHHLDKVLRLDDGRPVEYTDGMGIVGSGRYAAGAVVRGPERNVPRPSDLIVVAARGYPTDSLALATALAAAVAAAVLVNQYHPSPPVPENLLFTPTRRLGRG